MSANADQLNADSIAAGGSFTLAGTTITLHRMGYGAMQLAGKHVFGPPKDREQAIAVLREAVAAGVNHIDTADFYGPQITNEIIREALHPYPAGLVIVTKLGLRRERAAWRPAYSREALTESLHNNLKTLGLERMEVVNLRVGPPHLAADAPVEEPLTVLAELQQQGLIHHIGLSNVTHAQYEQGRRIVPIVCVQNQHHLKHRADEDLIDTLLGHGVAYVPYYPLGGPGRLASPVLDEIATLVDATPAQVALAWLLQRSPNVLLIPGTASLEHLRENLAAAALHLPPAAVRELDSVA